MSKIANCQIIPRDDRNGPLFEATDSDSGLMRVNLDGYAIIPIEKYHQLTGATGFLSEDHWPCRSCGAAPPTADGHDPCVANLPGVQHACCGHGIAEAYVMFTDGRTLRGHFDLSTPTTGG